MSISRSIRPVAGVLAGGAAPTVTADKMPYVSASYSGHLANPAKTPFNLFAATDYSSNARATLTAWFDTRWPKHADFGKPIEWVRVHKAPDYVKFDHSAHLNRGISCQSCHGRVDQMEVVYQENSLSMGWCLECHRKPTMKASNDCVVCHR